MSLRVALAQINPIVGDLDGNKKLIIAGINEAREREAAIVVFPEMSLTGYPPEDLLLKPDFLRSAEKALLEIVAATKGITAIVGCTRLEKDLYNAAAICQDGKLIAHYRKRFLPNYGVFDENRYFCEANDRIVFAMGEHHFGVSICEDMWYPQGPPNEQALEGGAELLINISASPFVQGKGVGRERMIATRATDLNTYIVYCNLVGGQDELVFDGHSLVCSPTGKILARGKQFSTDMIVVDLDLRDVLHRRLNDPRHRKLNSKSESAFRIIQLSAPTPPAKKLVAAGKSEILEPVSEAYQALVLALHDYVDKSRFKGVVLGLSGGIDSALTAAIAVDALGKENVVGVALPTRYSSHHSIEDAEALAKNLGIKLLKVPIDGVFQSFLDALEPEFKNRAPDLAEENLQPRIRGTLLMALSNKFGWLVITTGNKSEVAVGYSTLYGDTAGGFAVIKDIPKMLVYAMSRFVNDQAGREIIPERTITKPPSAELRPDQKDTDSLPPYEILDVILSSYVEENKTSQEIIAMGFEAATVERIIKLVERNEYKRRQSPPGPKITTRLFGKDRRMPISNRFNPLQSSS